jgi:hypothetical protein
VVDANKPIAYGYPQNGYAPGLRHRSSWSEHNSVSFTLPLRLLHGAVAGYPWL